MIIRDYDYIGYGIHDYSHTSPHPPQPHPHSSPPLYCTHAVITIMNAIGSNEVFTVHYPLQFFFARPLFACGGPASKRSTP